MQIFVIFFGLLAIIDARNPSKRLAPIFKCPPPAPLPAPPAGCRYNFTADSNGCAIDQGLICEPECSAENEERVDCGECVERSCEKKPPEFCKMVCKPVCQCIRGYVRGPNRTCISESDCPENSLPDHCNLPSERGRCKAFLHRYFYNSTSKRCEKFVWGGCGGNGNRFATVNECETACGVEETPTTTPTTSSTTTTTFQLELNTNPRGCPARQSGGKDTCLDDCKSDSDCDAGSVCCENWCGKRCLKPT